MFSYFTELNRKRPPVDLLDVVSFTTSAMVHAGDDRSDHRRHLQAIAGDRGQRGGHCRHRSRLWWARRPSACAPIPMATSRSSNEGNIRQAMNWNDPRQRGLLGAAWEPRAMSRALPMAVQQAVALGGLTGPFGTLHTLRRAIQQPLV